MARMHQTTVRFSEDLWALLEVEAARAGVSAAQFIRDSTLARIAYNAGRRGDPGFEAAVELAGHKDVEAAAEAAKNAAKWTGHDSEAVWAQGRLARERSRSLRQEARQIRPNLPKVPD